MDEEEFVGDKYQDESVDSEDELDEMTEDDEYEFDIEDPNPKGNLPQRPQVF